MSRYDDDQVIALLRSSVPAPPEAPDRMAAVRRKAGHQRTAVWTQTLGAVASVVLILGFAAVATGGSGGRGRVDPVARPLEALTAAFGEAKSVRFEASMEPTGDIDPSGSNLSERQLQEMLTASVSGAATKDGDLRIDGDLSFLMSWAISAGARGEQESHIRVVDGTMYRSAAPGERMPPGKKWLLDEGDATTSAADLDQGLRMLRAVAEDVRYVRQATVRDTPVAEYRLTVPARWAGQELAVTFALDEEDRLRRVATAFSWLTVFTGGEELPHDGPRDPMMVRVELALFGYDSDVEIEAPPTDEVVSQAEVDDARHAALTACMDRAKDDATRKACFEEHSGYESVEIGSEPESPDMEGCHTAPGPDGSTVTTCGETGTGWTGYPGAPPTAATASP